MIRWCSVSPLSGHNRAASARAEPRWSQTLHEDDSHPVKLFCGATPAAVSEYEGGAVQRRYIHGRAGVDERAVMIVGVAGIQTASETYYYLLRELDTVTGIATQNGALAECYSYDAYGKVRIWAFPPMDFNRDGDQDAGDDSYFWNNYQGVTTDVPPAPPQMDQNSLGQVNGLVNLSDYAVLGQTMYFGPPVELAVSGVGNPYFFTGRRLFFVDYDVCAGGANDGQPCVSNDYCPDGVCDDSVSLNYQLQHNRARHYDPHHGRWLQRDPLGSRPEMITGRRSGGPRFTRVVSPGRQYVDAMSLYEYAKSNPARFVDPSGLCTNGTLCYELNVATTAGYHSSPEGLNALGVLMGLADAYAFAEFLAGLRTGQSLGSILSGDIPQADIPQAVFNFIKSLRQSGVFSVWHKYKCKHCTCWMWWTQTTQPWTQCDVKLDKYLEYYESNGKDGSVYDPGQSYRDFSADDGAELVRRCADKAKALAEQRCATTQKCSK